MGWKYQGCADCLQFPLFCQLSKNLGVTALGVKELLLLTLGPLLRAAGKMDFEAVASLCEEGYFYSLTLWVRPPSTS